MRLWDYNKELLKTQNSKSFNLDFYKHYKSKKLLLVWTKKLNRFTFILGQDIELHIGQ